MNVMQIETLWSIGLSAVIGLISWVVKNHADEQKRLQILLNRTREEIARDYTTKNDVHAEMQRVVNRLDAMDAKIDRLIERLVK